MKSFTDFLTEVFNKKYPWGWISKTVHTKLSKFTPSKVKPFIGIFLTDTVVDGVNEKIEVVLHYDFSKDGWRVDFDSNLNTNKESEFKLTNKGDSLKKFSTIIDIITSAVKEGHIKKLIALSKEGNRTKLYKTMFKRVYPNGQITQDKQDGYDRLTAQI